MKLLSCHIENYGKIKNADYKFSDGLNEFYLENGGGKTTLASFIKAMFYGLSSYKSNTKTFCDRERFYPFDSGKFGGSITFEKDGDIYKIERFFGKKSETDDILTVYKNNKIYEDFGGDIGNAVFSLDENSFIRTAFFGADFSEICSTKDVNGKLGSYVSGDYDLKSAYSVLENARKIYKVRGGGKIAETEEKVKKLRDDLRNLRAIENSLGEKYEKYNALRKQTEENAGILADAAAKNVTFEKWKTLEDYENASAKAKEEFEKISAEYPLSLPDDGEMKKLVALNEEIVALKAKAQEIKFPENKEKRLKELALRFGNGTPSDEDAAFADNLLYSIKKDDEDINEVKNAEESPVFLSLERKFGSNLIKDEDIARLSDVEKKYCEADEKLKARIPVAGGAKKGKRGYVIAAVIAVLFIAGGIAALFFNKIAGVALLVAGGIFLFSDGFLYLNSKTQGTDEIFVGLQTEKNAYENEIRKFIAPYGYFSGKGTVFDLADFKRDFEKYKELLSDKAVLSDKLHEKIKRRDENYSKLVSYLSRFGYDGSDPNVFSAALKAESAEYRLLVKEYENSRKKAADLETDLIKNAREVSAVLNKYGIEAGENLSETLNALTGAIKDYSAKNEAYLLYKKKAEKYRKDNELYEKPFGEETDVKAVQNKQSEIAKDLAVIFKEIEECEAETALIDDKTNELETETDKLEEYKKKYFAITAALDTLKSSEAAINERYVAPVRETFCKYAAIVEKTLGEKIVMDSDFNVKFEKGGETRSEKHWSDGERAICALCFRLSLIDNMYGANLPFIVMDDPFSPLDENHMKKTAALISEIAAKRQILYFCPHESRKI